jgi:hypothetical protein
MKITSYTVRRAADLPPEVFHEFDSIDTRFIAGFENYQAQLQRVYVTWSRGGRPTAISTLAGPLITSCVDAGPWNGDNNWNNEIRRAGDDGALAQHLALSGCPRHRLRAALA